MDTKLSILFFARNAKKTKENQVPIYLRVTIDGSRFQVSTQRHVDPTKWSAAAGKVKGNSEEVLRLNKFLDTLRAKVYDCQQALIAKRKSVDIENFKSAWLGEDEKPVMLLEKFSEHNDNIEKLVDKGYSKSTHKRYVTSYEHTKNFLKHKYKKSDIDIRKLNYSFISDYEIYLKTVRNCNHNSTMKYLGNFKKVVILCKKRGEITKDPFDEFSLAKKEVIRDFLTDVELERISLKKIETPRVDQVRDIFLFCCYTGLAYADVKKLCKKDIKEGVDQQNWLYVNRQKTGSPSRIPLLPPAEALIRKYSENPKCQIENRLFPVLSNQKMNSYLKEVADKCDILKELTFHIARHTFATTVTLSNGISLESVSKMLGHKNLKTTQHYAKILDMKVSNDMKKLKAKYEPVE